MVSNMLFKRGNIGELFTSVRNDLASECTDVTLVCSDGKRLESQSRLLNFLSPLLRSISVESSQLLLLPDFSSRTVAGVVDLLKRKEGEEMIKLTRQQIDLLSCLGVQLTNIEEVVSGSESGQLGTLVCDLCDKKVMNAMEHMLEHSQEVGHLSPSEVDSFFHQEGSPQVPLEKTTSRPRGYQIQVFPEVGDTRSRRRERSRSTENRGLVVSDQVFCKLERNLDSESRPPPPAKKPRGRGRVIGKNRRVCYIQAGRQRLQQKKSLKIKAEENSSILNEDDFQLTLDVARTLAGRNTPQPVEEETPEVTKTSEKSTELESNIEIERNTEIVRNMEIESRSTGHMTLRPKLRPVSVQLLNILQKSHNPNKTKRLHRHGSKNKKQQRSENESGPKESVTENIESSLRNNILELENIVDDLSCSPEVMIEEMTKSSDLEIGEIVKDVVPLEIQLSEIDKEIAGLDENPVVELDPDEGSAVSGEVESIQEQLMEISDDEEDDGEIVLLDQQKTDIEILDQDFSFDNIDEILSVSLDEGSSELSLW